MACLSSTGLTINKYKTYNYGLNNDSLNNNNIIIYILQQIRWNCRLDLLLVFFKEIHNAIAM